MEIGKMQAGSFVQNTLSGVLRSSSFLKEGLKAILGGSINLVCGKREALGSTNRANAMLGDFTSVSSRKKLPLWHLKHHEVKITNEVKMRCFLIFWAYYLYCFYFLFLRFVFLSVLEKTEKFYREAGFFEKINEIDKPLFYWLFALFCLFLFYWFQPSIWLFLAIYSVCMQFLLAFQAIWCPVKLLF